MVALLMQAVALFSPQVTDPELVMCDNVTGVACSADGRHLLANYLNNHVYLFSIDGVGLGASPALAASPATSPGRARRESAERGAAPHNDRVATGSHSCKELCKGRSIIVLSL